MLSTVSDFLNYISALTFTNCVGWLFLSIYTQSYYIFFNNCLGLVLSLYYLFATLVILEVEGNKARIAKYSLVEPLLLGGFSVWVVVALVIGLVRPHDKIGGERIVGALVTIGTIVFYSIPVIDIIRVIGDRTAVSLELPMVISTLITSTMIFIYGYFALNNYFVYGPNIVGVIIGVTQLSLVALFGKCPKPIDLNNIGKEFCLDIEDETVADNLNI